MSKRTTDAVALLDAAFAGDVEYRSAVTEARINAMIARDIQRLRKKYGLTQAQLAQKIGTKQSAVSRLEKADYEGHSVTMFDRVARALNCHIELRLVEDVEPVNQEADRAEPSSARRRNANAGKL